MYKSARQSMAWLHSWLGLLLGWLLFCIFLTGTLTYYRQEINLWSQPTLANIQVNQTQAIEQAFKFLEKNATDAQSWFIQVAIPQNPINKLYWQKQNGTYENKTLDPNTGNEIILIATPLGEFFYNFHFQLFGIPYYVGRLIVSFAAFIMLISLISGIITHKKILTDFFTLRTFKGPRSYLDFHNVTSVIALPFFLTITFTGLTIFFYLYFPQGINHLYPKNSFQYFDEINTISTSTAINKTSSKMLNIQQIQVIVQEHLGSVQYNTINVKNPNTVSANITFSTLNDTSITRNTPQVSLNAITGQILENTKNTSPIATLNAGVYGLHMAKFAQLPLRLGLFFSGILGCLMIASGLLLWSLKRQFQQNNFSSFHLGYYLVDRLNITTLIGLPIAIICSFISNRLCFVFNVISYETTIFFSTLTCCFLLALILKKKLLWSIFLQLFILLSCVLITIDIFSWNYLLDIKNTATYLTFLGFDIYILVFICLAIFIFKHLEPIQQQASKKIKNKLNSTKNRVI